MEMFLMALCMSIFALGVTCAAFSAATQSERTQPEAQPEREPVQDSAPARFFVKEAIEPIVVRPRVPIEVLLLQIENHVRLEQAAAESFIESPTVAVLHSRTMSPLVH